MYVTWSAVAINGVPTNEPWPVTWNDTPAPDPYLITDTVGQRHVVYAEGHRSPEDAQAALSGFIRTTHRKDLS